MTTIVGLLAIYFKFARMVGRYEEKQEQIIEQVNKQETAMEKVRDSIVDLGKRVYELFGQLKRRD